MKKWISTLLCISLVIGTAAMLHACGKPKTDAETTTELTEEEPATLIEETDDVEESGVNTWEDIWGLEDMSYTERTTDEHYQEEYDALTLPMAVTTQAVAGTTKAQTTTNPAVRETTTQFQFTMPPKSSTTKKAAESGTTAAGKDSASTTATTAASTTAATTTTTTQPAEEETTMLTDYVSGVGVQAATVQPRPQVTLLDKYVTDVIKTGVYTMEMEMKEDGMSVPFTIYEDGNNTAVETSVTQYVMQNVSEVPKALANLGKVRFIIKDKKSSNAKVYTAWTGGYYELDGLEEVSGMVQEMQDENGFGLLLQHADEGLEYCGTSSGTGYVCEIYKDSEKNMQYNFYFAKTSGYEGIISMDVVNLSTSATEQHIVMRIYPGVTNSSAFKVSGKKYTDADIEKMFGGAV